MSPRQALEKAQRRLEQLERERKNEPGPGRKKRKLPEVWVIVDHDDTAKDELQSVARDAASSGVKFALSDPCFELWIILHFADSPGPQGGARNNVFRRLRNLHEAYTDYDRDGGGKRLSKARLAPLMNKENIQDATNRAYRLTKDCESGGCSHVDSGPCGPGDQDPSSGVYRLLANLNISTLPNR
jgi:hypothetical protein